MNKTVPANKDRVPFMNKQADKRIPNFLCCLSIVFCFQVKGTIYSLGLIGHTYETLSGATINTEKNEEDNYVVTEGDHTATIKVCFSLVVGRFCNI